MTTSFLSKHTGDDSIPSAQLAFVGRKLRNDLHDLVLRAFSKEKLTQAELAHRMGVDKAQVCRTLGAPGNWTIDTVAKLMFAINGSLVVVGSVDADSPALANYTQPSWLAGKLPPLPATAEGTNTVIATFSPPRSGPTVGGSFGLGARNLPAQQNIVPAIRIAAE